MNRKLPKPVFDALGRPPGSAHPSADLLAAFAEQALPAREADAVTAHLAQCGECRETAFLAAQAVDEDEVVRHPERDAAWRPWLRPAAREVAMARAPMAASPPQASAPMASAGLTMKPGVDRTPVPRNWRKLTWAAPLFAALVIAAAFIIHDRSHVAEVRENIAYQIANNKAGAEDYARMTGKAAPAPQAVPPEAIKAMEAAPGATALTGEQRQALVAEKQKKLEEYRKQAGKSGGKNDTLALAYREQGQQVMEAAPPPPGANAVSSAASQSNAVILPPPASATQNASVSASSPAASSPPAPNAKPAAPTAGSRGVAGTMLSRNAMAKSKNSMKVAADRNAEGNLESAQLTPPEIDWRISREGHLEVSIVSGVWRRVLADQPTTFHVVAVLSRKDVWAGGDGGALFHSTDGGQHFKKVEVAGLAAKATVISIQFDDAQHGLVGTEDGGRWRTTDGGATWTKL